MLNPFAIRLAAAGALAASLVDPRSAAAQELPLASTLLAIEAGTCSQAPLDPARTAAAALSSAMIARCRLAEGDLDGAVTAWRTHAERAGLLGPDWAAELPWVAETRARIELLDGRAESAAAGFDALLAASGQGRVSRQRLGRLLYYAGLAYEAAGQPEAALDRWTRLRQEVPSSEYAARIWLTLPQDGHGAAERLQLGLDALEGRHYAAAERLLRAAAGWDRSPLEAVAAGGVAYEAAYQVGFLLYRYRRERVAESIVWLDAVVESGGPRAADAAWARAKALERMDRPAEARRAWAQFVDRHRDDPRASEARLQRAWLLLHIGEFAAAVESLDAVANTAVDPAQQRAARRWAAWAQFRAGRYESARERYGQLLDAGGLLGAQAAYWRAVCLDRLGQVDAARAELAAVQSRHRGTWYGLLAAQRLGVERMPTASVAPIVPLSAERSAWARLAERGYDAEARLMARSAGDVLTPESATAELRMALWPGAQTWRAVRGTVPTDDGAPLVEWQRAFPSFWQELASDSAERAGVPQWLLMALIQQESSYDRFALSVSDAMGLMQVIPQTAERIALQLGHAYTDGLLFEPRWALTYGSWYVGALNRKFEALPLAIVAYNAGPIVTEAWVDRYGDAPLDEFVESIPFEQARDYVKKVTAIAAGYLVATNDRSALETADLAGLLPARVARSYRDGVDF